MTRNQWKFACAIFWVAIFLFIPSLLCYKAFLGILTGGDIFFLCLFAVGFCIQLICEELIKAVHAHYDMMDERRAKRTIEKLEREQDWIEKGEPCPECDARGDDGCWQCAGTGKVVTPELFEEK